MKSLPPSFGVLGVVAILLSGCATFEEPAYDSGNLVYYDVADAGATWCWEDDFGWRYLGEYDLDLARPCPPWAWPHRRWVDNRRHHHRPPPRPGERPHPGSRPCYFYFHHDGSVLTGPDGMHFNRIGQLSRRNEFVRHVDPTPYNGSFGGHGNRFRVAPNRPAVPRHWNGSNFADHTPSAVPNNGTWNTPAPNPAVRPGLGTHLNRPPADHLVGRPGSDLHRPNPVGDRVDPRPSNRRDGEHHNRMPPAITDRNRGNNFPPTTSGSPRPAAPSGNAGAGHSGGNRWSGGSHERTSGSRDGSRSTAPWSGRSSGGNGNPEVTHNHTDSAGNGGSGRSSGGNSGSNGKHRPDRE